MTTQEKPQEWEERFETESPLAFDGRKWAKAFIRQEFTALEAEHRKCVGDVDELLAIAERKGMERAVELIKEVNPVIQGRHRDVEEFGAREMKKVILQQLARTLPVEGDSQKV